MQMDPPNNTKDPRRANDALQLRSERQRVRCAAMTDEQREIRNRKRHEAYKMKKSVADKENEPGCNIQGFKSSDANTNIVEDPMGISGLRRESDRILSALNSNDKRLERNMKRREAYWMKKDITQRAAISSAEHHVECNGGTAPTIEHPLLFF